MKEHYSIRLPLIDPYSGDVIPETLERILVQSKSLYWILDESRGMMRSVLEVSRVGFAQSHWVERRDPRNYLAFVRLRTTDILEDHVVVPLRSVYAHTQLPMAWVETTEGATHTLPGPMNRGTLDPLPAWADEVVQEVSYPGRLEFSLDRFSWLQPVELKP